MSDGASPLPPHPARLTLVTLGGTALRADAGVSLFDVGKPLALITYLCCAPDRSAAREHLIDLLWGDIEPEGAKHALRQTLWYIRKRLGERALIVGGDVLTVVGAVDSDRDRFLEAVAGGQIDEVVRLYTGDFFPGFAAPGGAEFERWADIERQRLRALFWRSAETLVRRWMSSGKLRDAQALARRVRDSDPLRETGWRLLFETLIAGGDTVGGMIEADAFDRLAGTEGMEAEPATRALVRTIRQTTPAESGESEPSERPGLFAELVGREAEFARLLAGWEAARAGRLTHVHVIAPAGIGKTRLLMDVAARLRATRARTLFVRASLGAREIPFGLAGDLAGALAQLPGASGISEGSARALVALNPALSSAYPAALPDTVGDSADALRRTTVAVREVISAVAEEQPIAIFVDDLQWADTRSRQLIASILGSLEHSRVLVVTASRPTVDDLPTAEGAVTLRLAPLDASAVGALLASLAALPPELWAERLPEAVCEATGGSPLLVLETIQLSIDGGLLVRDEAGWSSPYAGRLFAALGAGGALRQRVERLDRVEHWVMTLLAVAGVPLAGDAITAAAGRRPDETASALGSLERRGFAVRHGDLWSPSHDEIAAMVAGLATPEARRAAARSLGGVLLDARPADTRSLRHAGALLLDAGDDKQAGVAFTWFAHRAREVGDRQGNRELADDFLGERSTPDRVARLVTALPVLHRLGLFSARRQFAAVGAIAFVVAGVALTRAVVRLPDPDVVLAVGSVGPDSVARLYRIPIQMSQLGTGSIIRPGIGRPAWEFHADPTTTGTVLRRPNHRSWTIDRVFGDSGGIDLVDVGDDGRERRLTAAVGDDQGATWSPDGRWLTFHTARWDVANRRDDIASLDARTGEVRRLTSTPDADGAAIWSADGSRIAFARRYRDARIPTACVIDTDGRNERCFDAPPDGMSPIDAWYDADHVIVELYRKTGRILARLDVTSGTIDSLLTLRAEDEPRISPDGRWVLCRCHRIGYSPTAILLFPLDDPNRVSEIDVGTSRDRRPLLAFAATARGSRYADSIAIGAGLGAPLLGVPHALAAFGITPAGDTIAIGSVRWTSLDTTIATIDSLGILTGRQPGRALVQADAGGWRRGSTVVALERKASAILMREDWSAGFGARWRPFGSPRPRVDSMPGFPAFLNNGEGSFTSGVYTIREYPSAAGIALDTWVSNPVTRDQWQTATISLEAGLDDAGLGRWDHVVGDVPRRPDGPVCSVGFPATDGASFGDSVTMTVQNRSRRAVAAPRVFREGAWFHVRVQLFPDGRCGVAVNGVAVGLSRSRMSSDTLVRALVFGNSVDTKVLVGPIIVRSGVPGDIDWSRTSDAPPASPPPGWSPRSGGREW